MGRFVAVPAVWVVISESSKVESCDGEMDNSTSELIDYFVRRSGAAGRK
jgi:biopolymer transport protein ExbB/biopolymer transport protein TolQ